MKQTTHSLAPAPPVQKFGTFLGVFTPSVLTILGQIMYLRFGWVVGNVGLPLTILIVLLASSITFITALSASAVATNMRVGVGGEYYMISRSLGLEFGGAIGIPLFLCRTLSITFYSFGLAEALKAFLPVEWSEPHMIQLLAGIIVVVITLLSAKSAGLVLKLQIPIMIAVGLSFLALIIGVFGSDLRAPEYTATYRTAPADFWYVFAVFFPAVTGFTAGIGMSGDLKDPQHSIPRGTLGAVAVGTLIYLSVLILLGITTRVSLPGLAEEGIVWTKVAFLGAWLVIPGVWGAILSSAFGSALGGPRVLQALASDGLAPKFLSRLSKSGQPTYATWVSGGIALIAVSLGGLNTVAQFVTILFLTLYVIINLSAATETLVGDPSYRPTIKVPPYVALAASFGALVVMFLISPKACLVAIFLEFNLYLFLRRRSFKKQWGDVRAGMWLALARFVLQRLHGHESDPRNWRPQILLFAGSAQKRIGLVRLASWFNHDRGVVTACQLVVGDLKKEDVDIDGIVHKMKTTLAEEHLHAYSQVSVVSDYENGAIDVVQGHGIGDLRCNTIMFGWPKKKQRLESILRIMRAAAKAGRSTLLTRLTYDHNPDHRMLINIWWGGLENNGDLMLLFAHLLSLNTAWYKARIVIRSVVNNEQERDAMKLNLAKLIPGTRIRAESEIILKPANNTLPEIMHLYSCKADVVFLGLGEPADGEEAEYAEALSNLALGFRNTIFVRNASKFAGSLV